MRKIKTMILTMLFCVLMAFSSLAADNVYSEAFGKMTDDEYELMAEILALEAQGEPF